jgi:hypothetical protein
MKPNQLLSIATYNVQLSRNVPLLVKNVSTMVEKGVVAFCFQEIINKPQSGPYVIDVILHTLGSHWQSVVYDAHEKHGTGIVWNTNVLTLVSSEKILLPKLAHVASHELLFTKLVGGKIPLQRQAIRAYFSYNNQKICIASIHLDHVGGLTTCLTIAAFYTIRKRRKKRYASYSLWRF